MAASILTNTSAMAALQSLAATQNGLAATQAQVSTGLKVATASDGAAYWSIATAMRSDLGAQSAVSDALAVGAAVVGTAVAAVNAAMGLLGRIKADLVAAREPGTSLAQVQTDVAAQQRSMVAVLTSASFNGVNLLDGPAAMSPVDSTEIGIDDPSDDGDLRSTGFVAAQSADASSGFLGPIGHPIIIGPILVPVVLDTVVNFVTSFRRGAAGDGSGTTLGTASLSKMSSNLIGSGGVLNGAPGNSGSTNILTMDLTAPGANLATMAADVDAAITSMAAIGALVGGIGTVIANQQTFVSALSNAVTSGIGSLVDADMNVASTRLQALQTQQQLGIQALSIANQNSQLVLKLFQAA